MEKATALFDGKLSSSSTRSDFYRVKANITKTFGGKGIDLGEKHVFVDRVRYTKSSRAGVPVVMLDGIASLS